MWELRDCGMRDSVGVYKLSHRLFVDFTFLLHREHLLFRCFSIFGILAVSLFQRHLKLQKVFKRKGNLLNLFSSIRYF